MSKQEYTWLVALAAIAIQGNGADDPDDNPPLLQEVYARAGIFSNAPAEPANDLAALQQILLIIWLWNCAKYLANIGAFAQTRAKYFQNPAAAFLTPIPAESRAIPAFPNCGAAFFTPLLLCQMNSSLTGAVRAARTAGAG